MEGWLYTYRLRRRLEKVQLYNYGGKLWAEKSEKIELSQVQEGVLYRFTFSVKEVEG